MISKKEVKPLKYQNLPGLSEKQLKEHHDVLYAGYVKKLNEIEEKLKEASRAEASASYSQFRELKLEETFSLNGVKLHEGYFDNLGGKGEKPQGKILEIIERDFGTYENWEEDFKACGMSARGWVVLTYDLEEKKLHNYICDWHSQGGVWNTVALLILDVYEHAYFIDYATGRKNYIETFMKNIDWNFVNEKIKKFIPLEN
ncbi:MAG: superoxide dismutase [Parcubacteria group bacterium]|nr:superoxide dismutase [Parcubacteria group bacterium]